MIKESFGFLETFIQHHNENRIAATAGIPIPKERPKISPRLCGAFSTGSSVLV
jgi:hypothetical protein